MVVRSSRRRHPGGVTVKLMVACKVLVWITVDTDTEKIGVARVGDLPENLEFPDEHDVTSVLSVDPEEDGDVTIMDAYKAIRLVTNLEDVSFEFTERGGRTWAQQR
jgi:hypothetical protein